MPAESRENPLMKTGNFNAFFREKCLTKNIDFISGNPIYPKIRVSWMICSSCGHTHTILSDLIIPYSTYRLFFILRVIAEYLIIVLPWTSSACAFALLIPCSTDGSLFLEHKSHWLGVLASTEAQALPFLIGIASQEYSSFSSAFTLLTSFSFLQSHHGSADYRQTVL